MSALQASTSAAALRSGRAFTRRAARASVKVSATHRVDGFSKSDIIVSPSILSANFAKLGEQVIPARCRGCLVLKGLRRRSAAHPSAPAHPPTPARQRPPARPPHPPANARPHAGASH